MPGGISASAVNNQGGSNQWTFDKRFKLSPLYVLFVLCHSTTASLAFQDLDIVQTLQHRFRPTPAQAGRHGPSGGAYPAEIIQRCQR